MAESHRDEIAKLESMYAANPEGRVFTHLAEAYRKAGDLVRAREVLEDGLRRHADSASGFVVLGRVMQDLDQPKEAASAFARVLELDPENRVALRALGDLAHAAGRTDEALAHFEQLLVLDPSDEVVEALVSEIKRAVAAAPAAAGGEAGASHSVTMEGYQATLLQPAGEAATVSFEGEAPPAAAAEAAPAAAAVAAPAAETVPPVFALGGLTAAAEASPAGAAEPAEPQLPSLDVSWPAPAGEAVAAWAAPGGEAAPGPAPEPAAEADAGVAAEEGQEAPAPQALELPVAAEPPAPPPWGMAGEEPKGSASPVGDEPAELVTETMAELYRSQGHLERAAEVYRALLRQRPGDEQLERKLLEVELAILAPEAVVGAGPGETPEVPAPPPEGFTPEEPEGFAAAAVDAVQSLAPAAEEPAEPAPVEPVTAQAMAPEPEVAEPDLAAPASEAQDAGLTELPEGAAWEEPVPTVESFGYAALEVESSVAEEPWTEAAVEEASPAEAPEPVWMGGGDVPVEEPTPYAWEAGPAEEDAGPPVSAYLHDLLSWRLTVAPVWVSPEPAPPVEESGYYEALPEPVTDWTASPESYEPYVPPQEYEAPGFEAPAPFEPPAWTGQVPEPAAPTWADEAAADPWTSETSLPVEPAEPAATEDLAWLTGPDGLAPESPVQPAAGMPPGPAAPEAPGDDDDLEMFRAWLQSLKK
jgi:tetratricopeptide (TPR) repeat protein